MRKTLDGSGLVLWNSSWELFDLPPGEYALELTAYDNDGGVITAQSQRFIHGPPTMPDKVPSALPS